VTNGTDFACPTPAAPPAGPVRQHARRRRLLAAGALATIAAVSLGLTIAGAEGQAALPALGPAVHMVYAVDVTSGTVAPVAPDRGTLGWPIRTGPLERYADGPGSLAFSPDGKTLYTVGGKGSGDVTPVDLSTGTVGRRIRVGRFPAIIAITPNGRTAYVASPFSSTVTPVDLARGVARPPIRAGGVPCAIVITPDGRTAYILDKTSPDPRRGSVTPITIATGRPGRPIPVGRNPVAMALTPDGTTLLVANAGLSRPRDTSSVTPVDVATGTVRRPIPIAQPSPWGFTFTPDGRTAYLPNWESGTVTPISLVSMTAGRPIRVGAVPWAAAITPDGKTVYVLNHGDGHGSSVTPVDTATGTPRTPVPVPGTAFTIAMSPDGRSVYVGSMMRAKLTTISTSTNQVSRIVMLGQVGPVTVAAGP
jgi:DNA-binding beta-propeller fold protein YncE